MTNDNDDYFWPILKWQLFNTIIVGRYDQSLIPWVHFKYQWNFTFSKN